MFLSIAYTYDLMNLYSVANFLIFWEVVGFFQKFPFQNSLGDRRRAGAAE